uniref:Fe2OG dioxygenase domain-containing protein n=1 Tax=Gossypium raimondii TaxID=29730 RepID=A0A0D2NAJ1_GOSRA|nr:hypothetical protein B456_001G172900 [Gossypium raimondii]
MVHCLPMVSVIQDKPMLPPTAAVAKNEHRPLAFDASILGSESNIPSQFIWPDDDKPCLDDPELVIPAIDFGAFLLGDSLAVSKAAEAVNEACKKHGLQLSEKQKAKRKVGESYGYASSFVGRFYSKLPWKETLRLYQEYCEARNKVSQEIMGLLGISLGLDQAYFKDFFEQNDSILRLNHYSPCQKPELTLGTGPHTDPTSLTILHQDQVGGLQVFADEKWHSVAHIPGAFVALTNGIYKSCLHRAVVNTETVRKSLAFFLCPKLERPVTPAAGLVNAANSRKYPDFTWAALLEFTQNHYRADMKTLVAFSKWVQEQESNNKLIP